MQCFNSQISAAYLQRKQIKYNFRKYTIHFNIKLSNIDIKITKIIVHYQIIPSLLHKTDTLYCYKINEGLSIV